MPDAHGKAHGAALFAVGRSAVGRTGTHDIAVVRDADGRLLVELRGHSRMVGRAAGSA